MSDRVIINLIRERHKLLSCAHKIMVYKDKTYVSVRYRSMNKDCKIFFEQNVILYQEMDNYISSTSPIFQLFLLFQMFVRSLLLFPVFLFIKIFLFSAPVLLFLFALLVLLFILYLLYLFSLAVISVLSLSSLSTRFVFSTLPTCSFYSFNLQQKVICAVTTECLSVSYKMLFTLITLFRSATLSTLNLKGIVTTIFNTINYFPFTFLVNKIHKSGRNFHCFTCFTSLLLQQLFILIVSILTMLIIFYQTFFYLLLFLLFIIFQLVYSCCTSYVFLSFSSFHFYQFVL